MIGIIGLSYVWGKGYATQAGHAVIRYGFEHLKLSEIIGIGVPTNICSKTVAEKIGMQYDKDVVRPQFDLSHAYSKQVLYKITR